LRMPGTHVAEKRERVILARMPGALNELHDAHTAPMAEHAKRQAEGSRALAFARTGIDDQQPLLDRLLRDFGILHRLSFRHLGAVPVSVAFFDFSHHFTFSGRPATIITT